MKTVPSTLFFLCGKEKRQCDRLASFRRVLDSSCSPDLQSLSWSGIGKSAICLVSVVFPQLQGVTGLRLEGKRTTVDAAAIT